MLLRGIPNLKAGNAAVEAAGAATATKSRSESQPPLPRSESLPLNGLQRTDEADRKQRSLLARFFDGVAVSRSLEALTFSYGDALVEDTRMQSEFAEALLARAKAGLRPLHVRFGRSFANVSAIFAPPVDMSWAKLKEFYDGIQVLRQQGNPRPYSYICSRTATACARSTFVKPTVTAW